MKKRRSKYGGLNALMRAMPLPEQQVTKMDISARVAWLKVCEGTATPDDYNAVAWVVNILEQGLSHLNNEEVNATVLHCAAVVSKALQQKLESDSWELSVKDLPEMQDMLDWYHQLLTLVTRGQLDKIVTEIEERRDREGKYIEVSDKNWEAIRASKLEKGS